MDIGAGGFEATGHLKTRRRAVCGIMTWTVAGQSKPRTLVLTFMIKAYGQKYNQLEICNSIYLDIVSATPYFQPTSYKTVASAMACHQRGFRGHVSEK